jgi:hypothetical protein
MEPSQAYARTLYETKLSDFCTILFESEVSRSIDSAPPKTLSIKCLLAEHLDQTSVVFRYFPESTLQNHSLKGLCKNTIVE